MEDRYELGSRNH